MKIQSNSRTSLYELIMFSITELHQTNDTRPLDLWGRKSSNKTTRNFPNGGVLSHVLDNWKRRPPFLYSDGCFTHSKIASLIPLSRYCSDPVKDYNNILSFDV